MFSVIVSIKNIQSQWTTDCAGLLVGLVARIAVIYDHLTREYNTLIRYRGNKKIGDPSIYLIYF